VFDISNGSLQIEASRDINTNNGKAGDDLDNIYSALSSSSPPTRTLSLNELMDQQHSQPHKTTMTKRRTNQSASMTMLNDEGEDKENSIPAIDVDTQDILDFLGDCVVLVD